MAQPFRLYNTLTRKVEPFEPLKPDHIGLYVCGMTVYDHAHVGHARAMVIFDAFVRYLRHQGWDVTFVRNYTDVDDKIIRRAKAEGVPAMEIAERYIASFQEDCEAMGLLPPTREPKVSDSIDDIIEMIQQLVDDGHAYPSAGSVWFKVDSYDEYGHLSGQRVSEMMASSEQDAGKASPHDFALWKAAKPGEPEWPSPWGPGRPGWHIECSAMSKKWLGNTIDIHGGGLDLVFPHHENEVAQSTCANHDLYSRWWMHNGLLVLTKETDEGSVGAAKMGKSLGNAFNIKDAMAQFPAEALRLYYLQAHYRSPLPWNNQALPNALSMLARLYEAKEVAQSMGGEEDPERVAEALGADAIELLKLSQGFQERFLAALDEDFNTSLALSHAFEVSRAINRLSNHKKARKRGGPIARLALEALEQVELLGLLTMDVEDFQEEVKDKRLSAMGLSREAVEELLQQRADARAAKEWSTADALRGKLDEMGIVVMDTGGEVSWRVSLS